MVLLFMPISLATDPDVTVEIKASTQCGRLLYIGFEV